MIHGKTVHLRAFEERDLSAARNWANDPELCELLDRARPVSDIEHRLWFESLSSRQDCVYFAIESRPEGQHVGLVWLWNMHPRHRNAELRIVIGNHSGHSRGLGSEAIALTTEFAFRRLNLHRVYAYVLDSNPRAVRAFEKAGFVSEGLLRQDRWLNDRYVNVHVLGRLTSESGSSSRD